jgi:formylglycine-generating enzyme required for sulfatase activity
MSPSIYFSGIGLCGLMIVLASLTGACSQKATDKPENESLDKAGKNSIGMKFALVKKGKFTMGSPKDEKDRMDNEKQHEVEITKDFYLGVYEVTQQQYRQIMGYNPSYFSKDGKAAEKGTYLDSGKPGGGKDKVKDFTPKQLDDFPVDNVSYEDALKFIEKLNEKEKKSLGGWKYSLPSEAQWEYSCRGGASSYKKYHFGDTISDKLANYNGNLFRTCKVGSYAANAFGLYDMHGNVGEWCLDWYDQDYYSNSPRTDPLGPKKGSLRVFRGGNWLSFAGDCRSADRSGWGPADRSHYLGFRVALVPSR